MSAFGNTNLNIRKRNVVKTIVARKCTLLFAVNNTDKSDRKSKKMINDLGGKVKHIKNERVDCDCSERGEPGTEDSTGYTSLGGESGEE